MKVASMIIFLTVALGGIILFNTNPVGDGIDHAEVARNATRAMIGLGMLGAAGVGAACAAISTLYDGIRRT
jgi:hypothetical protein